MITELRKPELVQPVRYEVIDAKELARRWSLPITWIQEQTRSRTADVIPHLRFGRYVRFEWGDPVLDQWLARRRILRGKHA